MKGLIKPALLFGIAALCLFEFILHHYSGVFRDLEEALFSLQWMLLVCVGLWWGSFIFVTFSLNDLPMIGLLLIAISAFFIGYAASSREPDAIILLAGVTLGRGARALLKADGRRQKVEVGSQKSDGGNSSSELRPPTSDLRTFLIGLILLLAFSSWWHLDLPNYFYQGLRWTGLWTNPNIYGMLMGAGVLLAVGMLIGECRRRGDETHLENQKSEIGNRKSVRVSLRRLLPIILFIAAGMMGVGLMFSYSRGAWVGAAVGLLYLAKMHGKFKWRFVLPGVLTVVAVVCFFWHSTADTDQWYFKRLDVSRPSAQHRVAAWRGAVQMMRDHPLGVGWNKAIGVYEKNYSPPEGGAGAITMNSYLMLGTELGLPGLLCFVAYVGLALKQKSEAGQFGIRNSEFGIQAACRAGAVVLLVAFWFDGGLFTLATAAVFWILLELSQVRSAEYGVRNETNLNLNIPVATKIKN